MCYRIDQPPASRNGCASIRAWRLFAVTDTGFTQKVPVWALRKLDKLLTAFI
jgi:hypothetical protein